MELVEGNTKYLDEYKQAYEETVKKYEKGLIKRHNIMFDNPDEIDVIKKMRDSRDKNKLPVNYVPSYDYFLVENDKFIGIIHIRLELTPNLLQYGGNIGYAINPLYWKKGYGTKILELGLKRAKELGIKEKVLITCDDDNIGSYKIIEKNGGILENKVLNKDGNEKFVTRRYWINL